MHVDKPHNSPSDEIDLGALFFTLWRGKIWIVLAVIIALLFGGYYAFSGATPLFKAYSTVALNNQKEQVVDIESIMTGLSSDQSAINTEVEVMRSRSLIEKLVIELKLVNDPEFNITLRPAKLFSLGTVVNFAKTTIKRVIGMEQAGATALTESQIKRRILDNVIDLARNSILVTNIKQSYVFKITVTTQDPMKSANIANALADLYIKDQLDVKFQATEQATSWLTERVSQLQTELEVAEKTVKDFISSTDLIGPESLAALTRQIKELRDRLSKAVERETQVGSYLEKLTSSSEAGNLEEVVKLSQDRTLARLVDMAKISGDNNFDAFNARVQQLRDNQALEKERVHNQVNALEASINELNIRISTQSDDLVKMHQLQREAEASRLIYEFFLGRLKETSAQQGILQSDSRILSQAVPRGASSPRKPLVLIFSVLLGGIIGSAFVLLRELLQNTIRTSEDLEARTGYNVMGQIPAIPERKRKNVLQYLTDKPTSAAAEAIRNLRTSILLSNVDNPPKIIMSTSSIPGEGKTTQSLALAQNLAGMDKKVLLVEGDIRKRVFAEYFHIDGKKGLLAVLSGEEKLEDVTIYNDDLKADVLIGEKSSINAADIFSSEKFHSFIEDVRKKYDYVVIDTPPVLAVPDARVIGQSVDSILYTVKWDSTSRRQVFQGLKSLEDVGAKATGLVLAQINAKGMKRYGYGDSYGAYNSYYDD